MNRTSAPSLLKGGKAKEGGIYSLKKFHGGGSTDQSAFKDTKTTTSSTGGGSPAATAARQGNSFGGPTSGQGGGGVAKSTSTSSAGTKASAGASAGASAKSSASLKSTSTAAKTSTPSPSNAISSSKGALSASSVAKTPTNSATKPGISGANASTGGSPYKPSTSPATGKGSPGAGGGAQMANSAPKTTVSTPSPGLSSPGIGNIKTKADDTNISISKGAKVADVKPPSFTGPRGPLDGLGQKKASPANQPQTVPQRAGEIITTKGYDAQSASMNTFDDPKAKAMTMKKADVHFADVANSFFNATDRPETLDQTKQMAASIAGEQYPSQVKQERGIYDNERAAIANALENRRGIGMSTNSVLNSVDANGRRVPSRQTSSYRAAVPGSVGFRQGMEARFDAINPESTFNRTAPPGIKDDTHYLTPAVEKAHIGSYTPKRSGSTWAGTPSFQSTRTPYGSHVFGVADNNLSKVQKGREAMLGKPAATTGQTQVASAAPGTAAPGKTNLGVPAQTPAQTMNTLFSGAEAAEPVREEGQSWSPKNPNDGLDQRSTMRGIPDPKGTVAEAVNRAKPSITGGFGVDGLLNSDEAMKAAPPQATRNVTAEDYDPLDSLAPAAPKAPPSTFPGRPTYAGSLPKAAPTPSTFPGRPETAGSYQDSIEVHINETPTRSVSPDAVPSYEAPETYEVEGPVMDEDGNVVTSKPVRDAIDDIKARLARGEIGLTQAKKELDAATGGKWSAGRTKKSVPDGYVGEKVSLDGMSGWVGVDKGVLNTPGPAKTATTTTTKPKDNPFRSTSAVKANPTPKDPNMGLGIASLSPAAPSSMAPGTTYSDIDPQTGEITIKEAPAGEFTANATPQKKAITDRVMTDASGVTRAYSEDEIAAMPKDTQRAFSEYTNGPVYTSSQTASIPQSENPMQSGYVSPEDQAKIDDAHKRNGAPAPPTTKSRVAQGAAGVVGRVPGIGSWVGNKVAEYDAMTSWEQKAFKEQAAKDAAMREANMGHKNDNGSSDAKSEIAQLHALWAQGVNIPDPTDPMYTEYMIWANSTGGTELAEGTWGTGGVWG